MILSFPDGDPDNPYNWGVVWTFAIRYGDSLLI